MQTNLHKTKQAAIFVKPLKQLCSSKLFKCIIDQDDENLATGLKLKINKNGQSWKVLKGLFSRDGFIAFCTVHAHSKYKQCATVAGSVATGCIHPIPLKRRPLGLYAHVPPLSNYTRVRDAGKDQSQEVLLAKWSLVRITAEDNFCEAFSSKILQ